MSPKKTFEHAHAKPDTHTHTHTEVLTRDLTVTTEVFSVLMRSIVKQKKEHIRVWDVFCLAERRNL